MPLKQANRTQYQKFLNAWGWLFVIIIPLSLIGYTYIHNYVKSQKVTFDESSTNISHFVAYDELVDIELVIDWVSYDTPVIGSNNELTDGEFTFHISYINSSPTPIYNVYVLPLLQTDWADIKVIGELKPISTTSVTSFEIEFNHRLPVKPLYFVVIKEPVLYLKVTYQVEVSGSMVTKTKYVKYHLTDDFPSE